MTVSDLEAQLKALLKGKHSSLSLTLNDENGPNYMTVGEAIENGLFEHADWVSEAERKRAIEANAVWTLQWYPDHPVSSYCLAGSTIVSVLLLAVEIANETAPDLRS